MAWIQINATVEEAFAEPLSDAFMEVGACSVTFEDAKDQPIFEPELGTTPIWQHTRVEGLFDAETDTQAIVSSLENLLPGIAATQYKIEALEDKDWVRAWMDQFEPMRFGQRLWIVPSWHTPPEPDAVNLMLDPGMAFGTGTHPTTSLCLTWLDQHAPTGLNVIDYDCGSGVLALAAQNWARLTFAAPTSTRKPLSPANKMPNATRPTSTLNWSRTSKPTQRTYWWPTFSPARSKNWRRNSSVY